MATVAVSWTSIGCSQGVQFETKLAPGFAAAHHSVSVLGVYKDGQMSSEAWASIGTRLASWLGTEQCPVGYGSAAAYDGTLVAAIDDYARANGPTDDLLTFLAPAAKGDLILILTLAGRPPTPEKAVSVADSSSAGSGMGGRNRGGGAAGTERRSHAPPDTNELDIVASLFSVSQRHSVAEIAMAYSGETVDDALARFAQKLSATLPGATCAAWDWNVHVDSDGIRRSAE
jgi:hypothetical protein